MNTILPIELESPYENWRQKYELFLDNIMRQILNALKIQETIRIEFSNLNEQRQQSTTKNESSKLFTCHSCKAKKISVEAKRNKPSQSHSNPNETIVVNETMARFQDLLNKQQQQQLNLLSELSKISDSLKNKPNFNEPLVIHRLPHSKSFNNQSTQTKVPKHSTVFKNNSEFNLKNLIISEPEGNSSFDSNIECFNSSIVIDEIHHNQNDKVDFKSSFENDSLDINEKVDDEVLTTQNQYKLDLHPKNNDKLDQINSQYQGNCQRSIVY